MNCKFSSLQSTEPTTLEEAITHDDSVHVIDMYYFKNGIGPYPPCSLSPSYCECMKNRGIIPTECE